MRRRPLVLLLLPLLASCSQGPNRDRTGLGTAPPDPAQLFRNAAALDALAGMWLRTLPLGALDLLDRGLWDGRSEGTFVPAPCETDTAQPLPHWGLRWRSELIACRIESSETSVETDGGLEVVWRPGPARFAAWVTVPGERFAYDDGVVVHVTAATAWRSSWTELAEGLQLQARYRFAVTNVDSSSGSLHYTGTLTVVGVAPDRFLVGGRWSVAFGTSKWWGTLTEVEIDLARCPWLDPDNGTPIAFLPPLMPVAGQLALTTATGERFEVRYGDCAATLLEAGQPVAFYDAGVVDDQRAYRSAVPLAVPGVELLRLAYADHLQMALLWARWCDAGGCWRHRFDPDADPALVAPLVLGTYAYEATDGTTHENGAYSAILDVLAHFANGGTTSVWRARAVTATAITLEVLDPDALAPTGVTTSWRYAPRTTAPTAAPPRAPALRSVRWWAVPPGTDVRIPEPRSVRPGR